MSSFKEKKDEFHHKLKVLDYQFTVDAAKHNAPINEAVGETIRAYITMAIANGFCLACAQMAPAIIEPDQNVFPKDEFLRICSEVYDTVHAKAVATTQMVGNVLDTMNAKNATKQ